MGGGGEEQEEKREEELGLVCKKKLIKITMSETVLFRSPNAE